MLSGIASCLPGGNKMLFGRYRASRPDAGTSSAGYCYAVWLRHLVLCHRYGGLDGVPKVVAELGPGNSLGTGLAALISGAEKYYALDVVDYSPTETNLLVFDALVKMFKQRRSIPVGGAYSAIKVELDSYGFPFEILSEEKLKCALDPVRIQGLREAVAIGGVGNAVDGPISHVVPWNDAQALSSNAVELISSMSVLEHIDDLATAYSACAKWLKPGTDGRNELGIPFSARRLPDLGQIFRSSFSLSA